MTRALPRAAELKSFSYNAFSSLGILSWFLLSFFKDFFFILFLSQLILFFYSQNFNFSLFSDFFKKIANFEIIFIKWLTLKIATGLKYYLRGAKALAPIVNYSYGPFFKLIPS